MKSISATRLAMAMFIGTMTMNADAAALPIMVKNGGAATRGAGVALYREHADIASGGRFTFVGEFKNGLIRLMDPPWVMVKYDRQLHWRIYFFMDTGEGFKRAVSKYLGPAQVKRVEPLPSVQKYIEGMEQGGRHARFPAPRLSLRTVYGDRVPKEFAKLDPANTKVGLYCNNLGNPDASLQQCFGVKPDKPPVEGVARFTGTLHLNRPDLQYHQREKQNLHHFNLKLADAMPIKLNLTEVGARRQFATELTKAGPRLAKLCEQAGLDFIPKANGPTFISWVDGQLAVSGQITPRPNFSMKPVPYATVTLCFDPETTQPQRILFVKRIHQDPRD